MKIYSVSDISAINLERRRSLTHFKQEQPPSVPDSSAPILQFLNTNQRSVVTNMENFMTVAKDLITEV